MLKLKRQLNTWLYSKTGDQFCRYFNAVNKIYWKYPIAVNWNRESNKIVVTEGGHRLFIARPKRVRRYKNGIAGKLDALADQYLLSNIDFHDGDYIVDCGANVGEVGTWLKRANKTLNVISIEPEVSEAECCDLNVYGGKAKTVRKALWHEPGDLTFYLKNDSGDSSLFETKEYDFTRKVPTTTLSFLLQEQNVAALKLLKLEAEGAEPEILAGAEDCLERIEYISADLGPERGVNHDTTAAAAINFLLSRGFELVDVRADRLVCLFRNKRLPNARQAG
ncbi:FkbM family methyltransferase [Mycolicibacterium austroafricanum]|uniref:FkbM family methyltransferase n=1 Tax=Mycolicibacterium austroafricanum TaxID=39687 RepID=UPI001403D410|nr:FkbM family methyltransferase [Mycolicibacterium austroafricanum]